MVVKAFKLEEVRPTVKRFPDVGLAQWFAPYIETGVRNNVIKGYGDGLFRPGQNINRVETLKMILISAGVKQFAGKSFFRDVSKDQWFYPYVGFAKAN